MEKIIKEILNNKLTSASRIDIKNKLESLYHQLEEVLTNIPKVEIKEIRVTDINSLVQSLKIYKLNRNFLLQDTYQSSYQLYNDLRKIILNRRSTMTEKVYVNRIVNQLSSATSIDIKQEDYKLFCIMKLVKENPDFSHEFTLSSNEQDILLRFTFNERDNHLLELKKLKKSRF